MIAAFQEIKPRYLRPAPCMGWSAIHQIASAMPESFIPNCVGTRLVPRVARNTLHAMQTERRRMAAAEPVLEKKFCSGSSAGRRLVYTLKHRKAQE